jgi:uncharacterized membrane protein (UPF0127 family)
MQIGGKTFKLEIAHTETSRTKGLMERDSVGENAGMIFVFREDAPRSFWMYHTRIPLDIIFVNSASRVVSIHTMQAYTTNSTASAGPAKYAIELNAGVVQKLGVKAGDTLELPKDLPAAME